MRLQGQRSRLLHAGALLAILAYFFYLSSPGLKACFTGDDLMNIQHLHGYFTKPFYRVVLDVFNPVTTAYRPLGGLFYRTIYALVGFHPLPFRVCCFLLLLGNLALAYRLIRIVTGSSAAALTGTLLLSFHPEMWGLYFNTGTVYDILCFTFFLVALTVYVERRSVPALLLANLLALQAKEMAWALPVVLFLYEACFVKRWRELPRRLVPCLFSAVLTAASLAPRILGHTGLAASPLYRPEFSVRFVLQSCARYWSLLFDSPGAFGVAGLLVCWAAMAAGALLLRSRAMAFGLAFWIVTLIPVAVIPPRDGFVLYLPAFGLALYAGALASRLRSSFRIAGFAVLFVALAIAHGERRARLWPGILEGQRNTCNLLAQLRRMHPSLAPDASVLFLEDPFGSDAFVLPFAFRLMYRDPEISVDRAATHPHVHAYQYVFRYAGGRLEELPARGASCPPPLSGPGEIDDWSPQLCWQGDWLTERFPQARGGGITHTNREGATVSLRFHGGAIAYVYTKAFNRGMAEITIDGRVRGVVDLYSPTVIWQARSVFDGLGPGEHSAVVRVLNRRNSQAVDSTVDVDAFEVR